MMLQGSKLTTASNSPIGSRRVSLQEIPSPRDQKPVDKMQKALEEVEKEIDYMAKLE